MNNFGNDKLLVVEDDTMVRDVLVQCLEMEGYDCFSAACADEALGILDTNSVSLMISDIMMPGKSGIELLTIAKNRYPDLAVIMVTALNDRKTALKSLELGAYGYVLKPFDLNEIIISVVNSLERRRLLINSREYETRLEKEVLDRTRDLRSREEEICLRLTTASDYRDEETGSHIRRLGLYAEVMAQAMSWPLKSTEEVRIAAPMHDIGKIGIPDSILLKPKGLTPEEFEVIKNHTVIGSEILGGSSVAMLQMAEKIALYHHEKWDGTGYPHGLKGTDIPESARLLAVIDVYDALVHERVYRPPIPEEKALEMMTTDRGRHFDPDIFDVFIKVLPKIRNIRHQVTD